MLTSYNCCHITEMELELKYLQGFGKTRVKKASILKAIHKHLCLSCHDLHNCFSALDKPLVVNNSDFNDNVIAE